MKPIETKLDTLVREIVRLRDLPKGKCFICDTWINKYNSEVAHFVGRSNHGLKWDLMNLHSCCIPCNRFDINHLKRYADRLNKVYGEGTAEMLTLKGRQRVSFFDWELQELYDRLKIELTKLKEHGKD